MSTYYRFFKVSRDGPLATAHAFLDEVQKIDDRRRWTSEALAAFAKNHGVTAHSYQRGGLAGFKLGKNANRKAWKKPGRNGLCWPKKNTYEGMALWRQIDGIPALMHREDCLKSIGLARGPLLIDGNRGLCAVVGGSPKLGTVLIKVPWRDVSPEKLDEYRTEREQGLRASMELDYLTWKPPEWLTEIKEWEALKLIDEMKLEAVKQTMEGVS